MDNVNNSSNSTVDLLQIKIERAKEKLPVETLNAIAAVDWRAAILSLRQKKGYNFEQLGDLELETELLLCGLTTPEEYPKELQTRMRISKAETDELVDQMNTLVFKKIKEELIKNSERKKVFEKGAEKKPDPIRADERSVGPSASNGTERQVEAREEILKKVENPETEKVKSILHEKILGSVQAPIVTTDHSIQAPPPASQKEDTPPRIDPYRELPE